MSKSNVFENDLLDLIFNGTAIPNLADNAATSPLTELYVALHTADPGESGDQSTSEAAYSGYARVAVARNGTGWVVSGNVVNPAANIDFPEWAGGSTSDITHFSIGVASSGATGILYKGALASAITMGAGVTPGLSTGTSITED